MKSPFKFLDAFVQKDKDSFFGRDEEAEALYRLVVQNRLTFVYGPSGIGKTSLVQCGLANRFDAMDWLPLFVRKGADINVSLRREIGKALGLEMGYEGELSKAINTLFRNYLRPVYLIFDQFEELFILGADNDEEQERLPFYENIADLLDSNLPCRLLFILREDYFAHLNQFEKIVPELYHRKLRVESMNRDNLLTVIKGSCRVNQIDFGDEANDPDAILDNIFDKRLGKDMPYVQVYLHKLYQEASLQQKKERAQISQSMLNLRFDKPVITAVGRIENVLGDFLKEQEQQILETLRGTGLEVPDDAVRRVLDVFVNREGTKVPLPYHRGPDDTLVLEGRAGERLTRLGARLVSTCLIELEQSRILRRSDTDFEIAHDTLAAIVLEQRSVDLRQEQEIMERIEVGYRDHLASNGTYFLNEGQLLRIEPYLASIPLEPEWKFFLEKSRSEVERLKKADLLEKEEELRRSRKTTAIVSFVALVAFIAFFYASWQRSEARAQTKFAEGQRKYAERQKKYAEGQERNAENARIKSDSLRIEADTSRKIAERGEETMKRLAEKLKKQKKEVEAANKNVEEGKNKTQAENTKLKNSNDIVVAGFLTRAKDFITNLQYAEALKEMEESIKVDANDAKKKETALALMEPAFFYTETGHYAKAKEIAIKAAKLLENEQIRASVEQMDTNIRANPLKTLRSSLKSLDARRVTELEDRYFGEMVLVKAGRFEVGKGLEKREVHLTRDFEIAKTETTLFQFNLFCEATRQNIRNFHDQNPKKLRGDLPVVNVSWRKACEYVNWLSKQKGRQPVYNDQWEWTDLRALGFRLPTELEWEYAARGGHYTENVEYAGNNNPDLVAWYNTNTGELKESAQKQANSLGLFDMSGNVWEWCWDWYGDWPNPLSEDYRGSKDRNRNSRVYRGGSWMDSKEKCAVWKRDYNRPTFEDIQTGFRIACYPL